jgi:hypothetical protein
VVARERAVASGAVRAQRAGMHITTFMILRDLVSMLERNHALLRIAWTDASARERFDRLARLTIHRSRAAIELYEEEDLRERIAIGAMYAACDVGLRLLELMAQVPAPALADDPEMKRVQQLAIRDLRRLVTELFDWVVVPNGEPMLEIEN